MIHDGTDDQSIIIGELFGTQSHKVVGSISSSGKSMLIDYKKQYYTGTVEFVASIKYGRVNPDCQSWLDNDLIISPINANINCTWIITKQFGTYITLDFKTIEVKPMQ